MTLPRPVLVRIAVVLAAATCLMAAGNLLCARASAEIAPPFKASTLAGFEVTPTKLHGGRPLAVLTFFGVNCLPCQKKLAQLNELWRDARVRECAVFYAINADGYDAGKLRAEIERRGLKIDFPVIADENQAITNLYVNGIVPYTVLIDKEFNVVMSFLGARPEATRKMEDRILSMSKEPAK